jgi:WD40 repeat protein
MTGSSDGKLCHWKGNSVEKSYDICKGKAVQSVACKTDKSVGEVVLVGGADMTLHVFKFDGSCSPLWNVKCDSKPLSLDLFNGNLLIAQKNGSISEMAFDKTAKPNVVMTSHCDGEVWGCDLIELENGEMRLLTSCDDNRILAYDVKSRKALAEGSV